MNRPELVPTPAPAIGVPRDPLVLAALKVMRPKQWTKNGLLAAALVFSGQFFDPHRLGRAVLAVMAFSLLSSSGYVLNDYLDREADRRHPKKRLRPIASGSLPEGLALPWMAIILLGGLGIAYWLSPSARRSWSRSATRPGPARTCVSIASRCSSSSRRSSRRPRSCRTLSTRCSARTHG